LAKSLIGLLDKYGLKKKIVVYIKGEGSNFNAMTIAVKSIVNCESLRLKENFQGTCLGRFLISIWRYKEKGLEKSKLCFYQIYQSIFAKMHHLT
jgi:hypothetical protein